ncbi:hypothetical protein [Streptomyces sp. NPDC088360]|uniref:hypothetical protein n=1 Tax=Streptomyces sp. NPDC088360 TaxID=3154515 RepID=UPI0034508E83
MSLTDERPVLNTPSGGTMSQPQSPQQWHSHPYVWAWYASLGALSSDYIERECRNADSDGAPPDAVYKARNDDPTMPGQWVTVGMIAGSDQQKQVRDYAHALVAWADALKAHRSPSPVRPLHLARQLGPVDSPPLSEPDGKMSAMEPSADENLDHGTIDIGPHPSAVERMYPLTFGPIAIHLGIDHYREDNAEECLRRAKAFFRVFDDIGEPLMHKKDGTPFTAEDIDEAFIRHHLHRRLGFGSTSNEEFDEHVAKIRARHTADA